jgi:hypothetical protein
MVISLTFLLNTSRKVTFFMSLPRICRNTPLTTNNIAVCWKILPLAVRALLKEKSSFNLVQNMGHKGPLLKPRCIVPGRARTQIPFNSNSIQFLQGLCLTAKTIGRTWTRFTCCQIFFIIIILNLQWLSWLSKSRVTDQALLIHYSAKNFLTIRYIFEY